MCAPNFPSDCKVLRCWSFNRSTQISATTPASSLLWCHRERWYNFMVFVCWCRKAKKYQKRGNDFILLIGRWFFGIFWKDALATASCFVSGYGVVKLISELVCDEGSFFFFRLFRAGGGGTRGRFVFEMGLVAPQRTIRLALLFMIIKRYVLCCDATQKYN